MVEDVGVTIAKRNKWDRRFLNLAKHIATWSKDPSTQCGAVIVRPDRTIASIGYNGFPRGCDDDPAIYADRERKYRRVVHCEMNAAAHAHERLHGCTLYTVPFMSCDRCAAHMIEFGITRCVALMLPAHLQERWKDSVAEAQQMFREAGIEVCLIMEAK